MTSPHADEPLQLFAAWFAEAKRAEPVNPDAMTLATVDGDGMPNGRMVLLKGFEQRGFVFYTNPGSEKGSEITPRQSGADVLLEVPAAPGPPARQRRAGTSAEADAYFATRSRMAQNGAGPANSRRRLKADGVREGGRAYTAKFEIGNVPRPPHWSGYRVIPQENRILGRNVRSGCMIASRSRRDHPGAPWSKTRLYP